MREDVKGACEILGLDPLFVANEGKLVAFVAPGSTAVVLNAMRQTPEGKDARVIGRAVAEHAGMVLLQNGNRRHASHRFAFHRTASPHLLSRMKSMCVSGTRPG